MEFIFEKSSTVIYDHVYSISKNMQNTLACLIIENRELYDCYSKKALS